MATPIGLATFKAGIILSTAFVVTSVIVVAVATAAAVDAFNFAISFGARLSSRL